MTPRPNCHDYEVEPDRIVRRDKRLDTVSEAISLAVSVFFAFAITLGAICLAVLVGLALFFGGW
ncbi:hypothetical protein MIC97_08875 [Aquamicrobium sp. NLF2-7]|uniref:hypothetical protein n=1 Tax=Aquamicrobium sp. NLF2-7 TaxID=2918753 RepID=UPI001EFBD745|nr:hypothetical protein [Aquamicrobium sp. NLF2-7]MCG8271614.1 hypothetical protein [Aquamicrobium sp. NLF2-7]